MTKKELKQLYFLRREIHNLESRKEVLESLAESMTKAPSPTAGVQGSGPSDPVGQYSVELAAIKAQIDAMQIRCLVEERKITAFIMCIKDSFVRQLITERYLNRKSWDDVAASIGAGTSGESCRKACERFLQGK